MIVAVLTAPGALGGGSRYGLAEPILLSLLPIDPVARALRAEFNTLFAGLGKRSRGPVGNSLSFGLRHGNHNVNLEFISLWHVASDKLALRFHKSGEERHISRKPIDLCDNQLSTIRPGPFQGCQQLRPVGSLPRLLFSEFGDNLAAR